MRYNKLIIFIFLTNAVMANQEHVINYPKIYKEECGSCHVAFPPYLLSNQDWRRIMTQLDKHYGSDAHLIDNLADQILQWLVNHNHKSIPNAPSNKNGLPLLTQSKQFNHDHHEIPYWIWHDSRVKSRANCSACHGKTESGSYSEHEIILPELRENED